MRPLELVKLSKRLSFYLRHRPDAIGLHLEPGGWVPVDALLSAFARAGHALTLDELEIVVATNDKRRFAFDEPGNRIRAVQGHSVEIELGLDPVIPPAVLWHGTVAARLATIRQEGLRRMTRHHVHLSVDVKTARQVGARRGPPIVLEVDATRMYGDGHRFYVTANDVWLTETVPPTYLRIEGRRFGDP